MGANTTAAVSSAVARLRALAGEDRLSARAAQLRRLADDLDAGNDLERWAEIDLYAAFLRDDTVQDRARPHDRPGWPGSVLEILPSVLIFLPIVVTWFGLYHATLAYRQSRGDPALANKSFLEQWQSGFAGRLPGWLYFDRIALWTLAGVGVLVVVSVAREVVRRRADRRAERERAADARDGAALMRELAAALTDADFELSRFRMNDASRIDDASRRLGDVAERGSAAAEAARAMLADAGEAMTRTREVLDRVEVLAGALLHSEDAVRAAAGRVGEATDGVGARLEEIAAATVRLDDEVAGLTRTVTADSERLRTSIEQIVTAAAQEMRGTAEANGRELGASVAKALDAAGTAIRQALDEFGEATGGIGTRLEEIAAATALVGEGAGGLSRSAAADSERLRTSTEQLLTAAVQEMRSTVDASGRELSASVAKALDAAVARIGEALDDWRTEGAIYSHRHETTAELLDRVMGSVERSLGGVEQSIGRFPAAVEQLGRHSEEAARRLDGHSGQAAQRLEVGVTAASAQLTTSLDAASDRLRGHLDDFLAGLPRDASQTHQMAAELAGLRASMDQLSAQLARTPGVRRSRFDPRGWFR